MQALNSFEKGLNKDLGVSIFLPNAYYDMFNMRLVTSDGLSTGNPENIKGNFLDIIIPECSNTLLVEALIDPDNSIQTITIGNGISSITLSFLFTSDWEENLATVVNSNTSLQGIFIHAAFKDDRVIIYSLLNSNILGTPNITITGFDITLFSVTQISPFLTGLKIIGWEVIRQDIYIFTTDSTNTYGQIWKFTYDILDPTITTISMVYNSVLNLSINFPIPNPGGIVGNYEGTLIQKLYWTDNNNKPRVANVADSNLMALNPDLMDLQTLIKFSIPILQNVIQGGNLKTGLYQYAYRLTMITGQESVFSQTSSLIPVNSHNEGSESYIKYIGVDSGNSGNKSLQLTINNLDTNYDRIQVIALYYDSPSTTPTIGIIYDEPVPDNGIFTFIHTGSEIPIDVTLDEFNIINTVILKAKTIASKNNYLFFGNIQESIFDVDYDARAYRFNSFGIADLNDSNGTYQYSVVPGLGPNWGIPLNADAVNPNQDPNSIGLSGTPNDPYLYQITNNNQFGGEGPNILYRFVPDTTDLTGSTTINGSIIKTNTQTYLDTTTNISSGTDGASAPIFQVSRNGNTFNFDNYTRVNRSNTFFDFHSPYMEAQLKGYTRGEVYRFGIVFFDSNGNQSYVKWIGDIQMPNAYMPNSQGGPSGKVDPTQRLLTYPITELTSSDLTQANNLGILFTINNIPIGVSGFSIVRCERTSNDKSILGQGFLQPSFAGAGPIAGNVYLTDDGCQAGIGSGSFNPTTSANSGSSQNSSLDGRYASFYTPEHLFNLESFTYSTGDKIEVLTKAQNVNQGFRSSYDNAGSNNCGIGNSSGRHIYFTKNYQYDSTLIQAIQLQTSSTYNGYLPLDGNGTLSINEWAITSTPFASTLLQPSLTSENIFNLSVPRPETGGTVDQTENILSQGIKTLVLTSNSDFFKLALWYPNTGDNIQGTNDIWIANYKRTPLLQYGGNSFAQRSDSEYISTGHYQPVITGITTYDTIIYGGDTYINIFDVNTRKKHFSEGNGTYFDFSDPDINPYHLSGSFVKTSPASNLTRFFPVETTVNIDLRQTVGDLDFSCGTNNIPTVAISNKANYDDAMTPLDTSVAPHLDVSDEFIYNAIYSKENNIRKFFPKSTKFVSDGVYDVRVRVSQKKTNNEEIDSWTQFKLADYIDIDTIEGPITNLIVHQDRLIAFQEKGISILSVQERVLINDNSGAELVLGTGGVLSRYDYISKIIGSRHQFGFTQSNDSVFFFDMNTKNLYKLAGNSPVSLSVAKGLTSYFANNLNGNIQNNDNPYLHKGITATYDFHYNEAVFTFLDTLQDESTFNTTIAYSDFIDAFTTRYGYSPVVYINDKRNILSTLNTVSQGDTGSTVYIHEFGKYGVFYDPTDNSVNAQPSTITIIVNPNPTIRKVYDTFQWESEVKDINNIEVANDTFNHIRLYNDHQDSGLRDYPGSIDIIGKKKERFWNLSNVRNRMTYDVAGNPLVISPTNVTFADRFRSSYLFLDLQYDNLLNNKIVLNTFRSEFRQSSR